MSIIFDKDALDKYLKAGRKRGKKLDHYKMLREINKLVSTDFCADMSYYAMPHGEGKGTRHSTINQKDARRMAELLGRIYSIAHCITCHACQEKYLPKEKP